MIRTRVADDMDNGTVLAVSNAYIKKYYFNDEFALLPPAIQDEIQILCVTFTEEIGGIFMLFFDADGNLRIRTESSESDILYDDIGAGLKVRSIQEDNEELFRSLELFYRTFS